VIPAITKPAARPDINTATAPLIEDAMTGQAWAKLATGALWVLLPLLLGAVRLTRTELK
jgi:hypothetical protein